MVKCRDRLPATRGDLVAGNAQARSRKRRRLADGGAPRVLDLFSGCGGFSLGFQAAGAEIVGAVEHDVTAAESHAINFFPEGPGSHAHARDILETDPADLVRELGLGRSLGAAVDVIVAGPPCQAFARIGRAKLREVRRHPLAFKQDARAGLYQHLLEFVRELDPLAVVIENVPDIMNFGGQNVAEEICDALDDLGYRSRYTLLNAAAYGVPQTRQRMFLVALAEQLGADPEFPAPTHHVELPTGYRGSAGAARGAGSADMFVRFVKMPPVGGVKPATTAQQALGDLAEIRHHLNGGAGRSAKSLLAEGSPMKYRRGAMSEFARRMRDWPGLGAERGAITDHVTRSLPRDYEIFKAMKPGDQYPEAHTVAMKMLDRKARKAGIEKGTYRYRTLKEEHVPPYDPGKFRNKWRKIEPDKPARTLMAHLGKDCYSHIHYDSRQARTITIREAARLQSFPDGFRFAGGMNAAYRQIGNAVPPLLAEAVARSVLVKLR